MEVEFRDASVKGPLWEQISRKLGELGYHRSGKKCKEKFENVYKYHKRTKDVRSGKSDSKSYKFFEQLQALENHPPPPTMAAPLPTTTVPSTAAAVPPSTNISFSQPNPTIHISTPPRPPAPLPLNNPTSSTGAVGIEFPSNEADLISNSMSDDIDGSTSSDSASKKIKKKRKWKDFFEKLMREVIQKQEEMQKRFLETIEKREQERIERQHAWKMQEMAKINRERDILSQERSMAAVKDAAITSILQKVTEPHRNNNNNNSSQPSLPSLPKQQQPIPVSNLKSVAQMSPPQSVQDPTLEVVPNFTPQKLETTKINPNCGENFSSSRWPKVEIEALINLRTNIEVKYQENGPKGQLWEEISSAMKRIGYNRNAKRCKEKWENINKYFKKVKENKKTRHEDSKTCPYFHQLDALYKIKNNSNNGNRLDNNVVIGSSTPVVPHHRQPLMVQPEQQWHPQQEIARPDSGNVETENDPMDRDDKDDKDEDEDEEEEDEGNDNYEIVASKPHS